MYFDELSSQFERTIKSSNETTTSLKKVIDILSSLWNIPPNLSKSDFHSEIDRQEKKGILIPDIPTYQIRFALEEGAWILLLREYFPNLVKDKFTHLIKLEHAIWKTGSADVDDLVYYLTEMTQFGDEWIMPLFKLWSSEHIYSTWDDFSPLLIASYFQSSYPRGMNLFEGAQRLLQTKLKDLSKVEVDYQISSWGNVARKNYQKLAQDMETNEFSELSQLFLVTLAIFQKELMAISSEAEQEEKRNQSQERSANWKNLDPENVSQRQKFSENIIHLLYQQTESDPLQAAINVFELIVKNDKQIDRKYIQKFQLMVNMQLRSITNPVERERKLVEIIQNKLPDFLIDIKKEIASQKTKVKAQIDVKELPIWDSFIDNLQRVPRLNDPNLSIPIVQKAVKSIYLTLIDKRMDPMSAINFILEELQLRMSLDGNTIERIKGDLSEEVSHSIMDDLSLVDQKIIEKLTYEFHEMAKK